MFREFVSKSLQKAQRYLAGLNYLNPTLDFGNGISIREFALKIEQMQAKQAAHNALVAEYTEQLRASRAELKQLEQGLTQTAHRISSMIVVLYGKDSAEYKLFVDAVGRSKKTVKKPAPAPEANTPMNSEGQDLMKRIEMEIVSPDPQTTNGKTNGNGKVATL
ncbi:MAG: hypothetical protein MUF49_14390 [Oculatellaceae cyanobacterium Prado106]|jgi:hypothetical protein|nr:hypothetical protein [Oculatellaceae cyanobacterium Prado106]